MNPGNDGFRAFQKRREWKREFDSSDLKNLAQIVGDRIKPPWQEMRSTDALKYFLVNLEDNVFGMYQLNLWKELKGPKRGKVHKHLNNLISCVDSLVLK